MRSCSGTVSLNCAHQIEKIRSIQTSHTTWYIEPMKPSSRNDIHDNHTFHPSETDNSIKYTIQSCNHLHPQASLIHFSILTFNPCIPTTQGCCIICSGLGLLSNSFSKLTHQQQRARERGKPFAQKMSKCSTPFQILVWFVFQELCNIRYK